MLGSRRIAGITCEKVVDSADLIGVIARYVVFASDEKKQRKDPVSTMCYDWCR